jgi:glutathione S-transferase
MKVYGVVLSPFVRKVLAVCSIKGLEYEVEPIMPGTATPEYLLISPLGKVPALEDGDLGISDSSVICEYLEEKYPAVATTPNSPEDRARSRWLEEYGDSKLVESIAPFFFERKVKKLLGQGEADETKLQRLSTEELPNCLAYLESQVPDNGFFFGELGVADIAIAGPFINGGYGGYQVEAGVFPKTAAYIKRVVAHPVLAPILAAEQEMLGAMFPE